MADNSEAIRRSSSGTLHHQLYEILYGRIQSCEFPAGSKIPTESELMETYSVSRTTARRALDELQRKGIIARQAGKGSFVLPPREIPAIPHLHSLQQDILGLGYSPGIRLISVEKAPASPLTANDLGIDEGSEVLVVKRVRTADDRPVYFARIQVNIEQFPELESADYSVKPMNEIVSSTVGIPVVMARQWFSAVAAEGEVARLLDTVPGSPVLRIERVAILRNGDPATRLEGFVHGELHRHYSEVVAKE